MLRGCQHGCDGQADGHRAAAADGLDHPRHDDLVQRLEQAVQPLELAGQRDQRRPDAEHRQRRPIDANVAVHVGQPSQQRHRHRVTQQVGRHHPDHRLQPDNRHFQIGHHRRQRGDHHRLIQRGDERAARHHAHQRPLTAGRDSHPLGPDLQRCPRDLRR